jgi:ubiquinone/menaquinone biosynthesis C-methylase UbiE
MNNVYTHGHHESVLRSHTWRTAQNSAAYLIPSLRPGLDLLDVGCGPGTLTVDLARLVAPGRVVGVDRAAGILSQAKAHAEAEGVSVEFREADAYALPFADGAFDVVHAHQVLQHLADPARALAEMRRVTRPGGVVAARDSDYGAFTWTPRVAMLDRWLAVYSAVTRRNGGEPDAGRYLKRWALDAGFDAPLATSSTWTFADPASCRWWGHLWADRCELSAFGEQAVAYGLSTRAELSEMAAAFRTWAEAPDAFFMVPHGEIRATA